MLVSSGISQPGLTAKKQLEGSYSCFTKHQKNLHRSPLIRVRLAAFRQSPPFRVLCQRSGLMGFFVRFKGVDMAIKSYAEKLKDPRWQKKRLEILSRDEWMCQKCQDKDSTLHVHHRYYEKGSDPWDYEDHALVTLCGDCHDIEQAEYKEYGELLVGTLKRKGFWGENLLDLAHGFSELPGVPAPHVLADIICFTFLSKEIMQTLIDGYFENISEKAKKRNLKK